MKFFSIYLIIYQMTFSSGFASETCKPNISDVDKIQIFSKDISKINTSLLVANEDIADTCTGKLSKKDAKVINALNKELADLSASAMKNKIMKPLEIRQKAAVIITKYEKKLSPNAVKRIIATASRKSLTNVILAMDNNLELSLKYLDFQTAIDSFKKQSKKFMHGFGSSILGHDKFQEESNKFETSYNELRNALDNAKANPETKRVLRKGFDDALMATRSEVTEGSLKNAAYASTAIKVAYASPFVVGGLGIGALAETPAALLVVKTVIMNARLGFTVAAGAPAARIAAVSALKADNGKDFFCNMADNIQNEGGEVLSGAFYGAVFGSVLGGLSTVAIRGVQIAVKVSGVIPKVGGVAGVVKEVPSIMLIKKQADEAKAAGDSELAEELMAKAKEDAVRTGVNLAATGVAVHMAGKMLKTTKAAEAAAKVKTTTSVKPEPDK